VPHTISTRQLTSHYADFCRRQVEHFSSGLRLPRCGLEFGDSLHRSISIFLRSEAGRLSQPPLRVIALPEPFYAEIQRHSTALTSYDVAQIIERRAAQWCSGIIELLERLQHDWEALVANFGLRRDGILVSISQPLGDPHNNGRHVYRLVFRDGRAIVYKPRPVDGEHSFAMVIRWLQKERYDLALSLCDVLQRGQYGWMPYVAAKYCDKGDDIAAFYERQGAFLAIFYVLCGFDCLKENAVAARDHPVWVDTECLCAPHYLTGQVESNVPAWLNDSVLATAFLFCGNDLGRPPRLDTALALTCVEDTSLVFTDHSILKCQYIHAVKRGFRNLYEFILAHREKWNSEVGPLVWQKDQRFRVVPRPTELYAVLADALSVAGRPLHSHLLKGFDELLRRPRLRTSWPDDMVRVELDVLQRGDIPFWSTSPLSYDIQEASGTVITRFSVRSGFECVQERTYHLSEKDLKNQLWLIDTFLRVASQPVAKVAE
jgi:lantibiotic modifying enzyme